MISDSIKEHTKTAHASLEKVVVQKLKDIRAEADYAALLKSFYAYFNALEQKLAPFISGDILPDHALRRKAGKLKEDIEALGGNTDNLPPVTLPPINSAPEAMGALYVMEGSVLGGVIIVQMLAKAGITNGISFFSGYGAENGAMWGKFVAALNRSANTADEEQTLLDAAGATFEHFKSAFAVPAV